MDGQQSPMTSAKGQGAKSWPEKDWTKIRGKGPKTWTFDVRQVDDRGRSQATVEMFVEENLGQGAYIKRHGGMWQR